MSSSECWTSSVPSTPPAASAVADSFTFSMPERGDVEWSEVEWRVMRRTNQQTTIELPRQQNKRTETLGDGARICDRIEIVKLVVLGRMHISYTIVRIRTSGTWHVTSHVVTSNERRSDVLLTWSPPRLSCSAARHRPDSSDLALQNERKQNIREKKITHEYQMRTFVVGRVAAVGLLVLVLAVFVRRHVVVDHLTSTTTTTTTVFETRSISLSELSSKQYLDRLRRRRCRR
jgi:hypothetical protein